MSPMEQPLDMPISNFGGFDSDHTDSPIRLDEPFGDNDSSAIFGSMDPSGMNPFGNVGMNVFDSDRVTPSEFDKDPADVLDPSVTSLTLDDTLVEPEPRPNSPLSMDVGGLEPLSERSPKSGVPSHPTTPQQSPPKPPPVVPTAPTMPAVAPYGYGTGYQNQNNFRYPYPTFPNQGQQFTPNQFPNMPYGNFPFGYNMPPVFNGQFQNAGFTGREAPGAYAAPPNPMFNMQHPGVVMPHPMGMTPEMMGQVPQPARDRSDDTLIDKPKPARKQRRRGDDLFETVDETNVSKGTRSRPRKIGKRSLSLVMPNIPHKLTLIS